MNCYTNPKKLASGNLEFVETPISIWGAHAAIFDEINKVNPFVQGTLPYVFWHRFWDRKLKDWREDRYQHLNKFTIRLCKKAKITPFNLHQLRHLATAILKYKANMNLANLQRFLRHDHQKTTEIYAGHIETGTKKQTDYLADFWGEKLGSSERVASITASIKKQK